MVAREVASSGDQACCSLALLQWNDVPGVNFDLRSVMMMANIKGERSSLRGQFVGRQNGLLRVLYVRGH